MKLPKTLEKIVVGASLIGCLSGCGGKDSNPVIPDDNNRAPQTYITGVSIDGNNISVTGYGNDPDEDETNSYAFWLNDSNPVRYWVDPFQGSMYNLSGTNTVYLAAYDEHGKIDPTPASRTFNMNGGGSDNVPPETYIGYGPSGVIENQDFSFAWEGSDNETSVDDLVFSYYLQGHDSNYGNWTSSNNKLYYGVDEGNYTFYVKAKDLAGNVDPTPAMQSFSVDVDNGGGGNNEVLNLIDSFELNLYNLKDFTMKNNEFYFYKGSSLYKSSIYNPENLNQINGFNLGAQKMAFDGNNFWFLGAGYLANSDINIIDSNSFETEYTGEIDDLREDIAIGGGYLWACERSSPSGDIFKYSLNANPNGVFPIIDSYEINDNGVDSISLHNGYLWSLSWRGYYLDTLLKHNINTMEVIETYDFPELEEDLMYPKMNWNGNDLWVTDWWDGDLYKLRLP